MSAQDNAGIVRSLNQAFNQRRFDEVEGRILSSAMVYTYNGREGGLDSWMKDAKQCAISFPDGQEVIETLTEDGDRVSVTFRFRGTHLGPLGESAATGRSFDVAGKATYRIMDGLIVEGTEEMDEEALGEQLGLK